MTNPSYVSATEFRAYLGDDTTVDTDVLDSCLLAAEAEINQECGRIFTVPTGATSRVYNPRRGSLTVIDMDDVANTTGFVVKLDTSGDGTYATTLTAADYQLEPLNGIVNGTTWPYTRVRLVGTNPYRLWPSYLFPDKVACVQITAQFGWPAIPEPIKMAVKILAKDDYDTRKIVGGTVGFGDFGAVRARDSSRWKCLIDDYVKRSVLVG